MSVPPSDYKFYGVRGYGSFFLLWLSACNIAGTHDIFVDQAIE